MIIVTLHPFYPAQYAMVSSGKENFGATLRHVLTERRSHQQGKDY